MKDRTRNRTRRPDGTLAPDGGDLEPRPPRTWGFQPGKSGNPGGRPKGLMMLRHEIAERTENGLELIGWALDVMRGRVDGMDAYQARIYAHEWLSDHYFGKPKVSVEVSPGEQAPAPQLQLREIMLALNDQDRADLERILGNLEQSKREGKLALPPARG